MSWTVLVPVKPFAEAKTRLASGLGPGARAQLAQDMFERVTTLLVAHPAVERLVIVSPRKIAGSPGEWFGDAGLPLNAALAAARAVHGAPFAVIHADLPLLSADDISELVGAASDTGLAIAPDRHGSGTNALALRDEMPFPFQFGPGSFALHRDQARVEPAIVRTLGLELDCDTKDDLEFCYLVDR